jgi:hypothetical protein
MGFLAAVAVGTAVASTAVSTYGAVQGAAASKAQAKLNQANSEMQAQLANYNADKIQEYGKINADITRTIAGLNNKITDATANTNLALISATTDFNVSVIGATTAFNVSSAEGAGKILEAQGAAESQSHQFNAQIAELQAQDSLEQGKQAETQSRTAYSLMKGRQRAALAANGVALDEGSALRIQSDTDYASDQDASTIRANAMKAALGYRVTETNEIMASRMSSLNAQGAAAEKYAEAVSAKINGATDIANARITSDVKSLDTSMTASFQMLNTTINADVTAMNITNQAEMDAWNARASALGYTAQGAAYGQAASSINPALAGATSLLAGAANVASSWYMFSKAGAPPSAKMPKH